MRKLLSFFNGVFPFFAAEAIQYIIIISFNIIYGILIGFQVGFDASGGSESAKEINGVIEKMISEELLYTVSVFAVAACGFVFFFWYRKEIQGEVRGSLNNILSTRNIILFLLMGIGCQFFLSGMMTYLQHYFIKAFTDYSELVENLTGGNDIVVFLLMGLIAPITEELIFRGVILHKTNRVITFLGANIMQAILFGIYHWNLVQGIYATFIGFLLGFIYYKYRSIIAPILLHMIINSSALLVLLLSGYISILALTLAGGIVMAAAIYLIRLSERVPLKKV